MLDLSHFKTERETIEHTDKVLAASRETPAVGHVVEEVLEVTIEGVDGTRCDEAEHLHVSVQTVPQFPVAAADVDLTLVRADRLHVAVPAKPVYPTS
jgi:hypothetical protein